MIDKKHFACNNATFLGQNLKKKQMANTELDDKTSLIIALIKMANVLDEMD